MGIQCVARGGECGLDGAHLSTWATWAMANEHRFPPVGHGESSVATGTGVELGVASFVSILFS